MRSSDIQKWHIKVPKSSVGHAMATARFWSELKARARARPFRTEKRIGPTSQSGILPALRQGATHCGTVSAQSGGGLEGQGPWMDCRLHVGLRLAPIPSCSIIFRHIGIGPLNPSVCRPPHSSRTRKRPRAPSRRGNCRLRMMNYPQTLQPKWIWRIWNKIRQPCP